MNAPKGGPAIHVKDLTMEYGPIKALDGVCMEIPAGQIVGLVGHNGAGKSTLVNAITGAVRPTAGEIRINGAAVDHAHTGDPLAMARLGMRVIHQEPSLAGVLSVADNITFKTVGERKLRAERVAIAREALARVGSAIDPTARVSTLGFGDRQIVDLARALLGDVRALLLDEPTAALGRSETDRLHALLADLAAQGKAIVYVSHRLRDIIEVCHRIVVLREGRIVMDRPNEGISAQELSAAVSPQAAAQAGETGVTSSTRQIAVRAAWEGHEYTFARGEIVGLFGMAGGPQFAFARSLYGLSAGGMGVTLGEQRHTIRSPREATRRGIFYVSADRERESLFHLMSALSNLTLPWQAAYSRLGFISRKRLRIEYAKAREMLNIVGPPMEAAIVKFSGGNRQKHVLGRWLSNIGGSRLLVLCQPNQGVDIGARADIGRALRDAAAKGLTVLVASSEVDEISQLATRAFVCETTPWTEVHKTSDYERALMETLLAGVTRRKGQQ